MVANHMHNCQIYYKDGWSKAQIEGISRYTLITFFENSIPCQGVSQMQAL